MSNQSSPPSRRAVLSAGSTLLAGFGAGMALPAAAATAATGLTGRGFQPG